MQSGPQEEGGGVTGAKPETIPYMRAEHGHPSIHPSIHRHHHHHHHHRRRSRSRSRGGGGGGGAGENTPHARTRKSSNSQAIGRPAAIRNAGSRSPTGVTYISITATTPPPPPPQSPSHPHRAESISYLCTQWTHADRPNAHNARGERKRKKKKKERKKKWSQSICTIYLYTTVAKSAQSQGLARRR